MNPVENNINLLISELKKNNFDKDNALDYIGYVLRTIAINNVSPEQRNGVALTVNEFLKKARNGDLRRAESFFGNWAKHHEEVESFDVNDIGC